MTTTTGFIPEKFKIFSGSSLKLIALITMITDHIGSFLLSSNPTAQNHFMLLGIFSTTIYEIVRSIGRIAFPIYCFLLTEGFLHTKNRRKYGKNLLMFALISELPWNFVHTGTWLCPSQNVFFTLFLGFLGLCVIEKYKTDLKKQLLLLAGLFIVSVFIKCDYGCTGFCFILMIYVLRNEPGIRAVIGSGFLGSKWKAGLAFIPILFYNGKRGFIKGKAAKYMFYIIYPLHMIILYFLKEMIYGYL